MIFNFGRRRNPVDHFGIEVLDVLRKIERKENDIDRTEHEILDKLEPRLHAIQITFHGVCMNTVTMVVGQGVKATVTGFDQFGAAFAPLPTPVFAMDSANATFVADASDPATADVTSVAAGTANLSATLTTAEGLVLSTSGAITNVTAPPPAPVLTSIQISFGTPA